MDQPAENPIPPEEIPPVSPQFESVPPVEVITTPPPPKKRMNPWLIVLIVMLVLLCCCCAAVIIFYFWLGDLILQQLGLPYYFSTHLLGLLPV